MIGRLGRLILGICVAIVMLAGCGGSQPPIGAPGVMSPSTTGAVRERAPFFSEPYRSTPATNKMIIYRFAGPPDGAGPEGALILERGKLYGTTNGGGGFSAGTVFRVTLSGKEKTLYSFGSKGDGENPSASLIEVNGTFYGTTYYGGKYQEGTVFKVTPSGDEKVIHTFAGAPDGAFPLASLVDVGGTLYGTTRGGGTYGSSFEYGTVFRITTSGQENVIHSFGGSGDGVSPAASLIYVKDKLYGTTQFGGAAGHGTVFAIKVSGREKVIHSFSGSPDGELPIANLVEAGGTLYGTTASGGFYRGDCRQNS